METSERVCVRVQHTHHRPRLTADLPYFNTSHADTKDVHMHMHMPCTCA